MHFGKKRLWKEKTCFIGSRNPSEEIDFQPAVKKKRPNRDISTQTMQAGPQPTSFPPFHFQHPPPQPPPPTPKPKPHTKRKAPAGLPKLCSAQDFLAELQAVQQNAVSEHHPIDHHTCVDVDSCWDQIHVVRSDLQILRFARRKASGSSRERFRESAYAIRDLIQIATGYLFKFVPPSVVILSDLN